MATSKQITCIAKIHHVNAHERITTVGGADFRYSEEEAIAYIESGTYSFYVMVDGARTDVIIATHSGRKYLKTKSDAVPPDNLLALPECG